MALSISLTLRSQGEASSRARSTMTVLNTHVRLRSSNSLMTTFACGRDHDQPCDAGHELAGSAADIQGCASCHFHPRLHQHNPCVQSVLHNGQLKALQEQQKQGKHLQQPQARTSSVANSRAELQQYLNSAQFASDTLAAQLDSKLESLQQNAAGRHSGHTAARLARRAITVPRPASETAHAAAAKGSLYSATLDAAAEESVATPTARAGKSCVSGRGILVVAGGRKLLTHMVVILKVLREHLHCSLPVEVAWLGPSEMDDTTLGAMQRMYGPLRGFDVQAAAYPPHMPRVHLTHWVGKVAALLYSSFSEVLLLDSDNIPLRDPSYLFSDPLYTQHGNLFWPDFWSNWVKPDVYPWLGLNISVAQVRGPSLQLVHAVDAASGESWILAWLKTNGGSLPLLNTGINYLNRANGLVVAQVATNSHGAWVSICKQTANEPCGSFIPFVRTSLEAASATTFDRSAYYGHDHWKRGNMSAPVTTSAVEAEASNEVTVAMMAGSSVAEALELEGPATGAATADVTEEASTSNDTALP